MVKELIEKFEELDKIMNCDLPDELPQEVDEMFQAAYRLWGKYRFKIERGNRISSREEREFSNLLDNIEERFEYIRDGIYGVVFAR